MAERSPSTTQDSVWTEPLSENEREIIAKLEGAPSWLIWRWLNHVLKCYDGLLASSVEVLRDNA